MNAPLSIHLADLVCFSMSVETFLNSFAFSAQHTACNVSSCLLDVFEVHLASVGGCDSKISDAGCKELERRESRQVCYFPRLFNPVDRPL
jgi:hypothetical protein